MLSQLLYSLSFFCRRSEEFTQPSLHSSSKTFSSQIVNPEDPFREALRTPNQKRGYPIRLEGIPTIPTFPFLPQHYILILTK